MNRTRFVFASAALLSAALATSGCEDTVAREALNSCKTEIEGLRKTSGDQSKALEESKKQLTEAQGKISQLTKENEELKAGKPHDKSEAAGKKSRRR